MAISKSSVRFSPEELSAPLMHTFLIYRNTEREFISELSKNPSNIRKTLWDSIHGKVANYGFDSASQKPKRGPATMEGHVDSIYSKVDYINYYIDNYITPDDRRNFILEVNRPSEFLAKAVPGAMSMAEVRMDRNGIGIILPEIEDLITDIKLTHQTPRGFMQRPIGIGGTSGLRFGNMAGLVGYKGVYVHVDNPELILNTRPQKIAMMGAFSQVLHMLPHYKEGYLNEFDVIKAAFLIDSWLGMGIDVTSVHDVIQILPLWNKWKMSPSIFGIKSKAEMGSFFLKMYVLGRYLSMLKASGIDTLIKDTCWTFTGTNVPGDNFIENCFNGMYKGDVSGLRNYWLWPAASSDMRGGYLQIMCVDPSKRNLWYPVTEPEEMKIRPTPIYV